MSLSGLSDRCEGVQAMPGIVGNLELCTSPALAHRPFSARLPHLSLPLGSEAVRRKASPSLFAPWLRGRLSQHFPISLCPLAQRLFAATLPHLSLPLGSEAVRPKTSPSLFAPWLRGCLPQHFCNTSLGQRPFAARLPHLSLPHFPSMTHIC